MVEVKFHHFNTFSKFSEQKISASNDDTKYSTYTINDFGNIIISEPVEGNPDIKYYDLVFVKDYQFCWTHGRLYQTVDPSDFITNEEFAPVSTAALNSITKGSLGTINGISLEDQDIILDLSLYKIVSELPTEDILNNKIYLIPSSQSTTEKNIFDEYIYNDSTEPAQWELIGQVSSEVDLSGYLTKTDAEKIYVKKSSNQNSSINTDDKGAMANFSDNGQAYLAVRPKTTKFLMNIPYAAAAFGVKDDGTAAFSHKQYATYDKATGAYTGARNTAVLQFAGPVGLRYAKNSGSAGDVTEDMYKYVGVIDSPDEFQRVYSAKQVDDLLKDLTDEISGLKERIQQLENI